MTCSQLGLLDVSVIGCKPGVTPLVEIQVIETPIMIKAKPATIGTFLNQATGPFDTLTGLGSTFTQRTLTSSQKQEP
jgi:hypothetical protein